MKEKDGVVANILILEQQQRRRRRLNNVLQRAVVVVSFGSQRCDAKLRFCDELRRRRYPKKSKTNTKGVFKPSKSNGTHRDWTTAHKKGALLLLLLLQKKGRHYSLFLSALVVSSKMGLVVVLSKSSNL